MQLGNLEKYYLTTDPELLNSVRRGDFVKKMSNDTEAKLVRYRRAPPPRPSTLIPTKRYGSKAGPCRRDFQNSVGVTLSP